MNILTDDDFNNVGEPQFQIAKKKDKDKLPYADPSSTALGGLNVAKGSPTIKPISGDVATVGNKFIKGLSNMDLESLGPRGEEDNNVGYNPEDPEVPKNNAIVTITKELSEREGWEPEWYRVENLPAVPVDIIRAMGKTIFKNYTKASLRDILALSTLSNDDDELKIMMNGLRKKGNFVADVTYDFKNSMPGYKAEAKVYRYKGLEFLVVKDFAGYYIYAWDQKDSLLPDNYSPRKQLTKQERFFRQRARRIKRERFLLKFKEKAKSEDLLILAPPENPSVMLLIPKTYEAFKVAASREFGNVEADWKVYRNSDGEISWDYRLGRGVGFAIAVDFAERTKYQILVNRNFSMRDLIPNEGPSQKVKIIDSRGNKISIEDYAKRVYKGLKFEDAITPLFRDLKRIINIFKKVK